MEIIALPVFVFLVLIKLFVIFEVILSLLSLLGILVAIPFISAIVQPMFQFIRNKLPVEFFGFDFSALILLIVIGILQQAILVNVPEIIIYLPQFFVF
ncbi:MAG: YggT family protein [Candidatus Gracilibacteria bacterium]|nr:YggT family protein [Candidatus Gracilibacteria bacterium]